MEDTRDSRHRRRKKQYRRRNPTTMTIYPYHIKTHGSESRGQEEAGLRDEGVSYLQVAPL